MGYLLFDCITSHLRKRSFIKYEAVKYLQYSQRISKAVFTMTQFSGVIKWVCPIILHWIRPHCLKYKAQMVQFNAIYYITCIAFLPIWIHIWVFFFVQALILNLHGIYCLFCIFNFAVLKLMQAFKSILTENPQPSQQLSHRKLLWSGAPSGGCWGERTPLSGPKCRGGTECSINN